MGLQKMIYDSFISSTKFSDERNFPNGIQNISDFTKIETDILTRCGYKMMLLFEDKLEPENEDQKRFLEVIRGQKKPLYHIEFVFLKYISLVQIEDKMIV